MGPLETNFSEHYEQNAEFFIHENTSEYIVYEMAVILSRGKIINYHIWLKTMACVKYLHLQVSVGYNEFGVYVTDYYSIGYVGVIAYPFS